ncbi:MAG TPA: YceI family protein [Chitinophagaceae bacterium]|nr:YceI family protein [Chitinophagaceae bacterium]
MKKFIVLFLLCATLRVPAQQIVTRNAYIGFFSKTPLEDIKAENNQANAVLDLSKQNIAFAVLMKGFLFKKELMQEHFNENYIESDQFPKATFTGMYSGVVDAVKEGTYNVTVKGQLTLHGVTRPLEVPAVIAIQGGKVNAKTNFSLKPQDFNIEIPALVREKIAPQIAVAVNADFQLTK